MTAPSPAGPERETVEAHEHVCGLRGCKGPLFDAAYVAAAVETARLPWSGCTGDSDCDSDWHEHGCYADLIGQCSDPVDHHSLIGDEARREGAETALASVRAVYALQCPVNAPESYMDPGAYHAHLWWQKVLGGVLDRADALRATTEADQ